MDNSLTVLPWTQPRLVNNGEWWWMQLRYSAGISEVTGEPIVKREGTVSWNADGTGYYAVFVDFEGQGLHQWPEFHALSDAQDFVEDVLAGSLDEARARTLGHWGRVIL